jgi:hypothetical protein
MVLHPSPIERVDDVANQLIFEATERMTNFHNSPESAVKNDNGKNMVLKRFGSSFDNR